jgi:hypothetical protein
MEKKVNKFNRPGFLIIYCLIFMLMIVSLCLADEIIPPEEISSQKGNMIIKNGMFSVEYDNIPLGEILNQIKDQNNIWFESDEVLLDEKISVRFEDLSLEEGMKRILNSINFVLVYHNNGTLAGVMLFNKSNTQRKTIENTLPSIIDSSSVEVVQRGNEDHIFEEMISSSERSDTRPFIQEHVPEIRIVKGADETQPDLGNINKNISTVDIVKVKTIGASGISRHMIKNMQGQ